VFSQFQPHVTLACDQNATALSAAFAQKEPQVLGSWLPKAVVLGPTGPCGTVLFFDNFYNPISFNVLKIRFRY
jgi:hypothetical protein